jgi:anaerobic selenocysteine-containing dehydrogenase
MQGDKNSVLGSQPPEKIGAAKLRKPDRVAAGMRAVTESLKFTFRESGFTRGFRDWFKINQKDGFACQSCAWPSPDVDPHVFEFCENGVKALTSEATRKKITPDFFREHSIADLQTRTDHWLELQGRLVHPMVKQPKLSR